MLKMPARFKREEYQAAFILLLPAAFGLIVFSFLPILQAFQVSFYDAPLLSPQRTFIGLGNYLTALSDEVFIHAFVNTVVYAIETVILQVVLALALALLIRNYFPGIGIFRSAYFLPVMTSLVVVSTVWKILYHTDNGLVNSMLRMASLPPVHWLTSTDIALWSLVIIGVWKEVGFSMLVLLGGLHGIPHDLYEAGAIDGATGWSAFWKITLPLLRRAMLFVVVLSTINAFKLFVPVYVITEGGPADSTQSIVYYIFRSAFSYYKIGYASALSFILLIVVVILAAIQFRVFRTDVEY